MQSMKLQIKNNFNNSANSYDDSANVQLESSKYLAKIFSSNIRTYFPKNIIDIGCGTGATSFEFLKIYRDAKITLCDISENMINIAEQKIKNTNSIICDAETYNFDNYYDLAISNLSLQWFENLELFINKIMKQCDHFAFSILTENSFSDYAKLFDIPPTFDYPPIDKLKNLYGLKYHDFQVYDLYFENAFFAAKYFKDLGANTSPNNNENSKIISTLLKNKNPIKLNYNIFFGIISKEGDL